MKEKIIHVKMHFSSHSEVLALVAGMITALAHMLFPGSLWIYAKKK
jgi:hypothetical protein